MHVVINGWFVGRSDAGSGQYIDHLLRYVPQIGRAARLTLLLPQGPGADVVYPGFETVILPVPALPANLAKLMWEQVMVPRAAARLHADVLWVPYWAAPWWQPCPVTVTIHDLIPRLLPAYRGGLLPRLYTRLVSLTARRAARVITISAASARDVIAQLGIDPGRVTAIHHGPNQQDALPMDAATVEQVRERYALPARYFLYLGGFDVRKNVRGILRAYARYLAQGGDPSVKLVIAGTLPAWDSDFAPDPQKIAAELNLGDQVQFCGWVPEEDKPAFYALATAYLFPSLYEGFGMTVLEAMAAGTPVVTSNR